MAGDRAGRPRPRRDRFAVPRPAGRAALAQRTGVGARHSGMAGRATRRRRPTRSARDLVAAYDRTFPSATEDRMTLATRRCLARHASSLGRGRRLRAAWPRPSSSPLAERQPSPRRRPRRADAVGAGRASPRPSAPTREPRRRAASAAACAVAPQTGALPSDRFTDIEVRRRRADDDRLTFGFGDRLAARAGRPAQGALEVAEPAVHRRRRAALPIDDDRRPRRWRSRFTGMSLQNDVGQPTYDGPREFKPDLQALRHAVLFDASEGRDRLVIGYDGPGCVTLDAERRRRSSLARSPTLGPQRARRVDRRPPGSLVST